MTSSPNSRQPRVADPYSPAEVAGITASMSLLARYSTPDPVWTGWVLIFRDHYVENTLGFLLAAHRAGIPAEWVSALTKGDQTRNRDRVHATLLEHGFASGVLDNTTLNAPADHALELAQGLAGVDAFIDAAHTAGRKVLVIDDGGLLAHGYGHRDAPRRVEGALELTVSGLKRIAAAGALGIPVFDLARSQLKTRLGYPEIADSCLRRLRQLLPTHKVIGRPVLVIGFGMLGSRLSAALRALGCPVSAVDTDSLALISAAESGYPTYRHAGDALRALRPFLVLGTTGEDALTEADLAALPDGVLLAPFATKDFSLLAEPPHATAVTDIPGVGRHYRFPTGRSAVLLGDGRSLNLYEADAIPNQGYDAYRAGTLVAATELCRRIDRLDPGVHTDLVDEIIAASGLFDVYYDTYLAGPTLRHSAQAEGVLRAGVVGYGVAGRLHATILADHGAALTILDPKYQDLPTTHQSFPHGVAELPDAIARQIRLWSVCCPTAEHLPVLRSILTRDPQARVLLEKPACQGHEIDALAALLASHRHARILVADQYAHATTLPTLRELIAHYEPDHPLEAITITFSKDRTSDISSGRFIDRCYGVLGYEWLHMLAILRQLLPAPTMAAYLASDPERAELWATYDARLFVSALAERTTITSDGWPVRIELSSSIIGSIMPLSSTPRTAPREPGQWRRARRPSDDRHRHITVRAGQTRFTAHLDPVTAPGGWQLDRNQHRITVERASQLLHDEVIEDSPLHTAIDTAVKALLGSDPLPALDLAPLRRIASLAELLRAQQPPLTRTLAHE
jgi:predicted dehydrogenase